MKYTLNVLLIAALLIAGSSLLAQDEVEPQPTYTDLPTYTPYPTYTYLPTYTPYPLGSPPAAAPSPTVYPDTPMPLPTTAPTITPTSSVPAYSLLANCEEFGQAGGAVTADTPVQLRWGWVVTEPQYITQHLAYSTYDVRVNDQPVEYADFMGPLRWFPEDSGWGVYWYVPIGILQPGEYQVTYKITWSQPIEDGLETFGPGTPTETIESGCSFTVQ